MREWVVADVVQQGGQPHREAVLLRHRRELVPFLQRGERASSQVVRAERVLETGVGGAGIDEKGVPYLAHIAQPLDGGGIEEKNGGPVEPNVVPERITDNFEVGGHAGAAGRHVAGPARVTLSGTCARNCSKLSRNMMASLRACVS